MLTTNQTQDLEILSYREGTSCHREYNTTTAILETNNQEYRIRIQERDEGVYTDLWEGTEQEGHFEPDNLLQRRYLNDTEQPESQEELLEETESLFGNLLN